MRNIFLFISLFISLSISAQKKTKEERKAELENKKKSEYIEKIKNDSVIIKNGIFVYDYENGLRPKFLVNTIDSLNQKSLFKKSINWIKETYKNPDEVINTTIENEKIRFTGVKANYFCLYGCMDVRYTIELSFKDGRYKFEPISFEKYLSQSGWETLDLNHGSDRYYNKKGELPKKYNYRKIPYYVTSLFLELNLSLNNYLSNNQSVKDNDKW